MAGERGLVLVVAAVLEDSQGRVLLARRPHGRPLAGFWEFPGGKLEPGELPEPGLVRELDEELGILVEQSDLVPLTFVSHSYPDFHLLMPLFLCRGWQGEVHPHEGQEFAWVTPDELSRFEMPPADEPLKLLLPRLL